jgi:hypothetical protein
MTYYLYELAGYVSLRRIDLDADPIVTERWDGVKGCWVDSPSTIAVTGLSSDDSLFREISLSEAEEFKQRRGVNEKRRTKKELWPLGMPEVRARSIVENSTRTDALDRWPCMPVHPGKRRRREE